MNGCFHSIPAEAYRISEQIGISDKFDSCSFSYRLSRNDEPISFIVNGRKINEIQDLTAKKHDAKDSWLHCWYALSQPQSTEELEQLKIDLSRMKKEFGDYYAFVPRTSLSGFINKLNTYSPKPISHGLVTYSDNSNDWSNFCKSTNYAYQREFRFAVGECSVHEIVHDEFYVPTGFHHYMLKNPEITLVDDESNQKLIEIKA